MFTRPPICKIGHLEVPPAALRHRFVREVELVLTVFSLPNADRLERGSFPGVIGTANEPGRPLCQLYGWREDVPAHVDNTGWIYFMLLRGCSFVIAGGTELYLEAGDVARLNDFCPHWTIDDADRVTLFWGPSRQQQDEQALMQLELGLKRLAAGRYNAPRVSPGFRVPQRDECLAWHGSWDGARMMRRADARKQKAMTILCSACRRRAIKVDGAFPYHWERNRCAQHLKAPAI